jgi:hypothetical protein
MKSRKEPIMQFKIRTAVVVAAMLMASAPVAFAQGGSTDQKYNATGSQHVGSKGGMTTNEHATTGSTSGKHRSKTHSMRGETAHHATSKSKSTGQSY